MICLQRSPPSTDLKNLLRDTAQFRPPTNQLFASGGASLTNFLSGGMTEVPDQPDLTDMLGIGSSSMSTRRFLQSQNQTNRTYPSYTQYALDTVQAPAAWDLLVTQGGW